MELFSLAVADSEFWSATLKWRETLSIIKNVLHFSILTEWKNTGIDQIIYTQSTSKKIQYFFFFLPCDVSIKRLQILWMCMWVSWINICSNLSWIQVTPFCKRSVYTLLNESFASISVNDHNVLFLLFSWRNVLLLRE